MHLPFAQSLLISRAPASTVATNTSIVLPATQPQWAEKLSPYLAGFSIEMDRWPLWAGEEVGQPNPFTSQVLQNLADRTGVPPFMRVGANSEDRAHVDLAYPVYNATFPAPTADVPVPEADDISIGRDFYALSGNLLPGTHFMWGINLKELNQTETVAQATLLADTFQGSRKEVTASVSLVNLELGNEPDFYARGEGGFDDSWTPLNYSDTWNEYAEAVSKVIDLEEGGTTLSAGAFASFFQPLIWNTPAILEAGIAQGRHIRSKTSHMGEHLYSGASGFTPQGPVGSLMDKTTIRSNLSTKYPNIEAARASGFKFILGETNSYANHGIPGLSNTAEAAIWATDYLLKSASMGIERLHFHHGFGFRYNMFQPTAGADDGLNLTSRAHILPAYHGFLIVNEAIGTSGNSYVAELQTLNNSISAYGIWEDGNLARMVVLNSAPFVAVNGNLPARPSFAVQLDNWKDGSYATVKRLSMPYTNAFSGLTWANQTFETESGVPEGTMYEEPLTEGVLNIDASSIALICFK